MKITRIYADNGRSRFADVDIALDPIGPLLGVSSFRASAPISVSDAHSCHLRRSSRNSTGRHDGNW